MKYEAVFGDQSLFDGAPEEASHATKGGGFYKIENMSAKYVSDGIFNGIDVLSVGSNLIAERRIIKTPVISGDIDDLIKDEFSEWWEKEGCLVRSGGGDRERTFAFAAYKKLMPEILAARGIKKTPVWTWEDKKAGRLPEVGSIVKFGKSEIEFLGVGEISNYWVCRYPSGVFAFRERGSIKPIETPAEKSQREEDEFVDALVSGYNKMPSSISFKAGIRAAYRKMRGGE
jgi:hypothetical protein